jgi:hypothetical protein
MDGLDDLTTLAAKVFDMLARSVFAVVATHPPVAPEINIKPRYEKVSFITQLRGSRWDTRKFFEPVYNLRFRN